MNIELKGAKRLKKDLHEAQDLQMVKDIVLYHTAALQQCAQRNVPVKTGHLKRSITVSIEDEGMTGVVKATADYAGYVEKGTRFMRAQPYMGPALNTTKPNFINDLERMKK